MASHPKCRLNGRIYSWSELKEALLDEQEVWGVPPSRAK